MHLHAVTVWDGIRLEACDGDHGLLAIDGHDRCPWHISSEGFTLLSMDEQTGCQVEQRPSESSFLLGMANPAAAHAPSCFRVLMQRRLSARHDSEANLQNKMQFTGAGNGRSTLCTSP